MNRSNDQGYVLVAVLVVLLGIGAGLLDVTLIAQPAHSLSAHAQARQRSLLIDARQSLISYATVYPYLYGPAGAGPAHFPCPDTDGLSHSMATAASGSDQRRDGPNPPCVSIDKSRGQLPRHTVLPGHRYIFHAQPKQRMLYEIDGQMINNPVNRIVNLSTLKALAHSEVASVSIPAERNNAPPIKIAVTANALIETTAASVAAWVMERSNREVPEHCHSPAAGDMTADLSGCLDYYNTDPDCENDKLWLQVLDYPITVGDACIDSALEDNVMEGVPAMRHWFVRNSWQSFVMLERGESCRQSEVQGTTCQLVYPLSSHKSISKGADVIKLQWVALP